MNNLHTRYLKRIILFAIFIIAFIPINLHAQEPELRFDNINIRDGLSQSSVYAILQDRQGFMWFGTQDGLNKYDGYDFTVFKRDPDDSNSLSGNWITSIYEDTAGIIWIGTYKNGLNRFDPKTNTFHHYYYDEKDPNSFHGNTVSYIYQDKAGTLWVSTDMGLNKVGVYGHKPLLSQNDPTKITFAFFKSDEEKQTIKDVLEDGNGRLWVATSTGLKEFDRETETFIVHDYIPDSDSQEESLISIPETDRIITSIAEDPQGYLWLGTDIGLLKFYPETGLFTFYEKDDKPGSLSDNGIKTVYIDSKWHLWIGTSMGGLNRFNRETETFSHYTSSVNNPTSLSNSEINVIYEDRGGILWVGTSLDGINKFNSMTEEFHHYLDELSHKSMWAFHEDNEGMLWIGTSFGLNKFDRQAKTITHYIHDPEDKTSLAGNFVQAIYEDSGHNLWVGASGLNKFDRETETFTSYQHDPDDPNSIADYKVSTIHEDETGNLWIGTGNSLEKFDIDSETFSHYRSDFPIFERLYMSVIEIDQDKSGMIWFAGAGLTKFDPDTEKFQHYFHEPDNPNSLSENSTSSIYADENGMIWVSTYGGGFNKFDPQTEKFTAYREKHGLPNDFVYGILGDKEGNLWMSTNNGISKFNPETETFRNYTDKNGLQSNEFNGGAFYQSPSGEMFFGGVNGFNAFYPEKIKDNPHAPQVVITRFKKMNEEGGLVYEDTNFLTYLDLPYYSYLFTIYFAGLDYADPLENQYMYKLEGFDNDWVESNANERFALYSNLAGGDYVFRAKAANNDGTWSEEGLTIDVHITPPPWKTWWAYTIYVLIVAGLIFSYIRYRTTQQKLEIERKEKELEQERIVSERLRQLDRIKDEFLANTSHELRTPINGIVGLAESLIDGATGMLPEQTVYNLSMIVSSGWRLTNLVNDLLDFSKLKHKTLELNTKPVDMRSLTDVVLMLCRSLVGTKDIEIHNNISHDVPLVDADENRVQQIMYNLIGNAIKFTSEGKIEISARGQESGVRGQESGVRSQESGVRGQESGVRGQGSESINPESLLQNPSYLAISISDTGIGIPEDKFEQIFESFEQVEGDTARKYSGTGIGLAVTKQLVDLHDGQIWLESELGKGSTFTFTLPLAMAENGSCLQLPAMNQDSFADMKQYIMDAPKLEGTQETLLRDEEIAEKIGGMSSVNGVFNILIVDDEPVNLQVLVNHLSIQNYSITQASDGYQALAAFENGKKFDLILLDIMMPRMSGYEVCQRIRELYPAHETPILMLTAKNQVTDLVEAFGVGANDYLTKPISKHELLTRIQTHIRLAKINIAYGRFVPYEFLEFLNKESIVDVHLGDHVSKEMAVMFSDIRSFTTLSEKMTPQENFDFVNEYLNYVSPIIREHDGFIVKYLGDGMMAVFPNSADDAVKAAIIKLRQVMVFNSIRQEKGQEPIKIGIGIHIGHMMVGMVGEVGRMQGDAFSDNVNLTARLEGLTKFYGASLVISGETLKNLGDNHQYNIRFLDRVIVKGRVEPIDIHEILDGEKEERIVLKQKTRFDFEEGLRYYQHGEFDEARIYFEKVLATHPQDYTAELYKARIDGFIQNGVPDDWQGVAVLTAK